MGIEPLLEAAGLSSVAVGEWLASDSAPGGDDRRASDFLLAGQRLLDALPSPPRRAAQEAAAAQCIKNTLRSRRVNFLRRHASELYARLTDGRSRYVRVEDLVYRAA